MGQAFDAVSHPTQAFAHANKQLTDDMYYKDETAFTGLSKIVEKGRTRIQTSKRSGSAKKLGVASVTNLKSANVAFNVGGLENLKNQVRSERRDSK